MLLNGHENWTNFGESFRYKLPKQIVRLAIEPDIFLKESEKKVLFIHYTHTKFNNTTHNKHHLVWFSSCYKNRNSLFLGSKRLP